MQNHQWLWNEISPAFDGIKSGKNSFTLVIKGRTGKGKTVPWTVRHTQPFTVSPNGAASFGKQTNKILEYSWQRETSCSDCSSAVAITFLGGWKLELRTLDPMTKSSFYLQCKSFYRRGWEPPTTQHTETSCLDMLLGILNKEEKKAFVSQALENSCKKRPSLAGTFFQGSISGNCVKTQYYSWCFKGSHPLPRDTGQHTYSCRWEWKQKCYVLAAATPAENIFPFNILSYLRSRRWEAQPSCRGLCFLRPAHWELH